MTLSLSRLCYLLAAVVFVLIAVGFGPFHLGTVTLQPLGLGLALLALGLLL